MRLATDTGGTFTDLIIEDDDGSITLYKAPTVASDPVTGVLDALSVAAEARGLTLSALLAGADTFIHGTTHALNAIITANVAKTALFVTKGHRDILLFREGGRAEPFNHNLAYPRPYIPRSLTFEIDERVVAGGAVLRPLDEAEVVRTIASVRESGAEAVAVALLWSTIRPDHELAIARLLEKHLEGVPYTLSHAVNPTLREFRRTSSAAIDASLKPLMSDYIGGLTRRLSDAGFTGDVMVLTSSGGMMDAADVAAEPIRVINSGPSMAPVAGRYYADRDGGYSTAIIADTGGTTYDISLVSGGHIPMTRDLWIGEPYLGHLAGFPSVDVKSVGAGGGSIASLDTAGLLHVGPQSAGAMPGPACYGRGGTRPTVTDACVALGHIDPDFFLGGRMKLDAEAARTAINETIAQPMGVSVEAAAWSILDLATENMVQAIQELTVNQGIDPASAVLIGGGGAAGLNSVFIARRLACSRLIIPETGAAMSAAGAMMSDITNEFAATIHSSTADFDMVRVNDVIARLKAEAMSFAGRTGAQGEIGLVAEARYEGQAWDIDVPLTVSRFETDADVAAFRDEFDAVHERIFTIRDEASGVELVGLRVNVRCRGRGPAEFALADDQSISRPSHARQVYFAGTGFVSCPVVAWNAVETGQQMTGPAIIESPFTTVVIDPGARFWRSPGGALQIET